jgi:hypothetical protein
MRARATGGQSCTAVAPTDLTTALAILDEVDAEHTGTRLVLLAAIGVSYAPEHRGAAPGDAERTRPRPPEAVYECQ